MNMKMFFATLCAVAFLGAGVGQVQAQPAKAKPERSAKSLECSKQADGKSLHGKPRKKFMSTCKKS